MTKRRGVWGGARPGSGPKPLPDSERRRHAALVRMNDAERAMLLRAAGPKPLVTWLRTLALRAARRRTR